ncbi:MAG: hypothetical protein OEZ14_17415 [Acidimicrobiia bacterium]|nr:hypothetical protein [Acidimicrobiia bacterium]MDH5522302.1 hypothetical protein [Acidimicrobiia bacterium]
MEIIAALFMDDIELRSVPGPSTRIDLGGIQFSAPAPAPVPVTVAPHLVVLVWNPPDGKEFGALEVTFAFHDSSSPPPSGDGSGESEPLARNVQPLQIEPGKFNYRLIRADLEFDDYRTVVATCRIDGGRAHIVPYTLLPPVE